MAAKTPVPDTAPVEEEAPEQPVGYQYTQLSAVERKGMCDKYVYSIEQERFLAEMRLAELIAMSDMAKEMGDESAQTAIGTSITSQRAALREFDQRIAAIRAAKDLITT